MTQMQVFGGIAPYYDTFYESKDYESECDFIEQVFARYAKTPIQSIVDIGCGTGGHLLPLARRGYRVTGVDRSSEMLSEARRKAEEERLSVALISGDAQSFQLGHTVDAAISMFAVFSYLTTLESRLAALRQIHHHLVPGGLCLFDVWFGPGVLTDPPTDRTKIMQRGDERVIRLAHSESDLLAQVVTVHYKVFHLRNEAILGEVDEQHAMHFFFPQEVLHLLEASGFQPLELCPFMRLGERPDAREWNLSVIARKR